MTAQKRLEAKKILGKYGSVEVTWKKFDCGNEGCGECKVCKYQNFLDWVSSVSVGIGCTIQRDAFIEKYLKLVYKDHE